MEILNNIEDTLYTIMVIDSAVFYLGDIDNYIRAIQIGRGNYLVISDVNIFYNTLYVDVITNLDNITLSDWLADRVAALLETSKDSVKGYIRLINHGPLNNY